MSLYCWHRTNVKILRCLLSSVTGSFALQPGGSHPCTAHSNSQMLLANLMRRIYCYAYFEYTLCIFGLLAQLGHIHVFEHPTVWLNTP